MLLLLLLLIKCFCIIENPEIFHENIAQILDYILYAKEFIISIVYVELPFDRVCKIMTYFIVIAYGTTRYFYI